MTEKPSARLFVSLVLRYVREGRGDLAAAAIFKGVQNEERQELLARLAGLDGQAAEAARAALEREPAPGRVESAAGRA